MHVPGEMTAVDIPLRASRPRSDTVGARSPARRAGHPGSGEVRPGPRDAWGPPRRARCTPGAGRPRSSRWPARRDRTRRGVARAGGQARCIRRRNTPAATADPDARRTEESAPSAPMRWRQRCGGRPRVPSGRRGRGRRPPTPAPPRRRPRASTELELPKRPPGDRVDHSRLGVERDRAAPGEGHVADTAEASPPGRPSGRELAHGLGREPAGAGLGADLRPLFQHQHLAARLREDLRRPEAGRAGADDQVLNVFHASSSRMRAAGVRAGGRRWVSRDHPIRRSRLRRPTVDIREDVARRQAGGAWQEEEVHVAHALAVGRDVDPLGPDHALDRGHRRRSTGPSAAASAGGRARPRTRRGGEPSRSARRDRSRGRCGGPPSTRHYGRPPRPAPGSGRPSSAHTVQYRRTSAAPRLRSGSGYGYRGRLRGRKPRSLDGPPAGSYHSISRLFRPPSGGRPAPRRPGPSRDHAMPRLPRPCSKV